MLNLIHWSRLQIMMFVGMLLALLIAVLFWFDVFMPLRLGFNDIYVVPAATQDKIVLIAIDDASLGRYGATPAEWSRQAFADLLNQLSPANPRVIAFDLLFSEPKAEDEAFAAAISAIQQNQARTR